MDVTVVVAAVVVVVVALVVCLRHGVGVEVGGCGLGSGLWVLRLEE